jgi:hypothetical protein
MGLEQVAEEKIREAIEQGQFSNLAGEGTPLAGLDDDASGDDWAGLHLLRQNGFLPEWLELRKHIYEGRPAVERAWQEWEQAIRRWGSERHAIAERAGEVYAIRIREINGLIDLHNHRCPAFSFEIARYPEGRVPTLDQSTS